MSDKEMAAKPETIATTSSTQQADVIDTGANSATALRIIDGNNKAAQYLARLQAQQADPDELAALLASLHGELLHGACKLIEKSLRGRHA